MIDPSLLYIQDAQAETSPAQDTPSPEKKPEYKIIGKSTSRIDGRKIVTGKAPFIHDIKLRGMLVGKILRSPHPNAEITSIDLTKAKSLQGVKAAIDLDSKQVIFTGNRVAAVAAVDEQTAEKALAALGEPAKPSSSSEKTQ